MFAPRQMGVEAVKNYCAKIYYWGGKNEQAEVAQRRRDAVGASEN